MSFSVAAGTARPKQDARTRAERKQTQGAPRGEGPWLAGCVHRPRWRWLRASARVPANGFLTWILLGFPAAHSDKYTHRSHVPQQCHRDVTATRLRCAEKWQEVHVCSIVSTLRNMDHDKIHKIKQTISD